MSAAVDTVGTSAPTAEDKLHRASCIVGLVAEHFKATSNCYAEETLRAAEELILYAIEELFPIAGAAP